jgi:ADP-heptose:LPS heptosyltransferase
MKPQTRAAREKILVVRRDNIGDLVCTTPLIRALRRRSPTAWIGALVNSYNAPVLRNNPDLDEVVAYTKLKHLEEGEGAAAALGRRLADLWRLRRLGIDLAVLATPDFSPRLVRTARLLGARKIAGFSDGSPAAARLDHAVLASELRGKHEVERVYALAPLLGLEPAPPPLIVIPDPSEVAKARAAFRPGRRLAVHISARRPLQRWPAESFVALIRHLCEEHGASVMLLWSPGASGDPRHPGDDEKAHEILSKTAAAGTVAYPTRRLEELIGALAASDALVCSDGGAMHLAAALGRPIACFFGDSPVERWHPWGVPHRVLRAPSGNVRDIPVEDVAAAFRALVQ